MTEPSVWYELRRCLLDLVSVIEGHIGIEPTTSEVRKVYYKTYPGASRIPRGADDSPSPAKGNERVGPGDRG